MDIVIEIKGGLVRNVLLNGVYITTEIHDYDIDGCSLEELNRDKDGSLYIYYET